MAQHDNDRQGARVALCQAIWDLRRGIARHGGARANQVSFGRMLTDPDYRARVIHGVRASASPELRELAEAAARCNTGELAESPVSWDAAGRSELDIEELTRDAGPRRGARGPVALAGTAAAVLVFALAGGVLSYFFSAPLAAMLAGEAVVSGTITEDTTWTDARTRVLDGMVYVTDGATLTIRAGTRIEGRPGSALIVARDGELRSRGRREAPVVFTSAREAGERERGDWGGVALLGNAPINVAEGHLEGVPPDDERGRFGGAGADGSCGVIEYTRIEFAGHEVAANIELNGLTLGGCGSATVIRKVQVHKGLDDGVELFGGTANLERVVITRAGDDGLDWDLGWRGNAQFLVVQQEAEAGDNAIEADNNRDDHRATPRSAPTIANATLVGSLRPGAGQRAMTLRRGTGADFRNLIVTGFPTEMLDLRDRATADMVAAGRLRFAGLMTHRVGPRGRRIAVREGSADADDDGGFDEARFLRRSQARIGTDPDLPKTAFNVLDPDFVPAADSPAGEGAVAVPQGEFWNTGADFLGAVDPDTARSWLVGWTAFPDH